MMEGREEGSQSFDAHPSALLLQIFGALARGVRVKLRDRALAPSQSEVESSWYLAQCLRQHRGPGQAPHRQILDQWSWGPREGR